MSARVQSNNPLIQASEGQLCAPEPGYFQLCLTDELRAASTPARDAFRTVMFTMLESEPVVLKFQSPSVIAQKAIQFRELRRLRQAVVYADGRSRPIKVAKPALVGTRCLAVTIPDFLPPELKEVADDVCQSTLAKIKQPTCARELAQLYLNIFADGTYIRCSCQATPSAWNGSAEIAQHEAAATQAHIALIAFLKGFLRTIDDVRHQIVVHDNLQITIDGNLAQPKNPTDRKILLSLVHYGNQAFSTEEFCRNINGIIGDPSKEMHHYANRLHAYLPGLLVHRPMKGLREFQKVRVQFHGDEQAIRVELRKALQRSPGAAQ